MKQNENMFFRELRENFRFFRESSSEEPICE